jgi:hypothetical protein
MKWLHYHQGRSVQTTGLQRTRHEHAMLSMLFEFRSALHGQITVSIPYEINLFQNSGMVAVYVSTYRTV